MDDNELKLSIFTSPDEGYRKLFEKYHGYVFSIVYRILGSSVSMKDAEDCVVDIFADVIMHLDTASDTSLRAFVGTVARNKAINLKRSAGRCDMYPVPEETAMSIPDESVSIEEAAENSYLLNEVLDHIDALGEPDSTIIIQKYLFGRSSAEIAAIVSMSPTAVRVRLSRAMKKIRSTLAELGVTL